MPRRLVLSPELLLLAPLPEHRRAVGAALRDLIVRYGEMPLSVAPLDAQGEVKVMDGFTVLDTLRFTIEDWYIPEPAARSWRLREA